MTMAYTYKAAGQLEGITQVGGPNPRCATPGLQCISTCGDVCRGRQRCHGQGAHVLLKQASDEGRWQGAAQTAAGSQARNTRLSSHAASCPFPTLPLPPRPRPAPAARHMLLLRRSCRVTLRCWPASSGHTCGEGLHLPARPCLMRLFSDALAVASACSAGRRSTAANDGMVTTTLCAATLRPLGAAWCKQRRGVKATPGRLARSLPPFRPLWPFHVFLPPAPVQRVQFRKAAAGGDEAIQAGASWQPRGRQLRVVDGLLARAAGDRGLPTWGSQGTAGLPQCRPTMSSTPSAPHGAAA